MLSPSEIRQILEQRGFRPLRQFGQNFLSDENMCRFIVSALGAGVGDDVLEIGPGLGSLTHLMLSHQWNITALEIDHGFCQHLSEQFASAENFCLIEGDALKEIPLLKKHFDFWIGNLPYNISTPLLVEILRLKHLPQTCVFMFQKEIAQRLAAQPRSKDYGAVSVFLQSYYEIEVLKTVPPHLFIPQPNVHSIVVRMKKIEAINDSADHRGNFYEFLRKGFSHRRKKLKSVLNVDLDARAEELSVGEWHNLYEKCGRHL